MQNQKNEGGTRSFFGLLVGLLTIVFVALKLCNVINWSWWWVLSPLWIYAILVIFLSALVLILH